MVDLLIGVQSSIIIEIKNQRPLPLLDLTASLAALGQQFERRVQQGPGNPKAQLYVRDLRSGSVIAELVGLLEGFDAILEHREIIAGFMANWQETLSAILGLKPEAKSLDKSDVKAARTFVQPIARDKGSQMNVFVQEGGNFTQNFFITSDDADKIVRNAGHLLGAVPMEEKFFNEPMRLFQVRNGPPSQAGDRGFIDRFSSQPKKLTFGSEDAKASILDRHENPFEMLFFVTGIVKTAGGVVAAYHITNLESAEPRSD